MQTFNEAEPRVGDEVFIPCDVLAEVARQSPGSPYTWRFLEAGTRGRLIGWRDRDRESRAVIDVADVDRRLVVFVGEHNVTRARH